MACLQLLARAWREDNGQELIEYGLIIALVVTATVALFPVIASHMGTTFRSWGSNGANISIPYCPGTTTPCQ
jgi:Flp pilus assembly pilin Flp